MERWANNISQRSVSTLDTGTGLSDTNFSMVFGEGGGTENWIFFRRTTAVGYKTGILFKAADHKS